MFGIFRCSMIPFSLSIGLFTLGLIGMLGISACGSNRQSMPKPRTYPRVIFPEKSFQTYRNADCGFGFEFPEYARVEKDSLFIGQKIDNPCWFNLVFPAFNGEIHCTYYGLDETNQLDSLIYDSFALVGKHTVKADYIQENKFRLPGGGGGMLFRISGPVASPTQFFITDSVHHFLRGSLYFNNRVQIDSMQVIYDFVDEDIDHLLKTFYWE